jgi:hypothetical protein
MEPGWRMMPFSRRERFAKEVGRAGSPLSRPMRLRRCLVVALALLAGQARGAADPAGAPAGHFLTRAYPQEELQRHLLPLGSWRFFPPAADREGWDALLASDVNRERERYVVKRAEALLGRPWPELSAVRFMDFARNGNRTRFQDDYFARRENLAVLVLAECLEHRGRFMDEIANGIWAISEETTWALPAHVPRRPGDVLPRLDIETVDLFAAETAMTLATTRYLLRDELDRVSPILAERVKSEVLRRVVEPVEASDHFGHADWLDGHNNWSPWCSSNVLGAGMLILDDPVRLARLCERLMTVVDRFIDKYQADGGCDEGPSYWGEASGQMLLFLELLHSRTSGWVDIYGQPKIAAMGLFILRDHLAGPWFLNFADADAKSLISAGKVYRFGERVHSPAMMNLALLSLHGWRADGPVSPPLPLSGITGPLVAPLMDLFWIPAEARPVAAPLPAETWLPDLQVLVARETPDEESGLILGAKGGHNAPSPSHSHNDAGHFVVFLDGQPGVIDVGIEEYTAQNFGPRRFELWFTRGSAHNAPIVNGVEEEAGPARRATEVQFSPDGRTARLGLDLEAAYPPAAGLRSLRRTWEFTRGPGAAITVRDAFALARAPGTLQVNFFSALPATVVRPGAIAIACSPRRLLLEFDPARLHFEVIPVPLIESRMRANWGAQLWRIALTRLTPEASGDYAIRFRAEAGGAH